jgi:hypothetical protein
MSYSHWKTRSDFHDSPHPDDQPELEEEVLERDDRRVLIDLELSKAKTAREVSEVLLKYGIVKMGDRKPGSGLSICGTSITEPENQEDTLM